MNITLQRVKSTKSEMFGVLISDTHPLCTTLEDAWKTNKQNISCIPSGKYKVKKFNGFKFKDCWQIMNVPNRTHILIHTGNTHIDTSGCVLVGKTFTKSGIGRSREAMDYLRAVLPDEFELEVIDPIELPDCFTSGVVKRDDKLTFWDDLANLIKKHL